MSQFSEYTALMVAHVSCSNVTSALCHFLCMARTAGSRL